MLTTKTVLIKNYIAIKLSIKLHDSRTREIISQAIH